MDQEGLEIGGRSVVRTDDEAGIDSLQLFGMVNGLIESPLGQARTTEVEGAKTKARALRVDADAIPRTVLSTAVTTAVLLAAWRPALKLDLASLDRQFTIRCTEGFVETFGPDILSSVASEAPHVRLWFVPKLDKDSTPLRDGLIDLETGVISKSMGPEIRTQGLFRDRFIAVVRKGHALTRGKLTPERYAAANHILISRRGLEMGPVDQALEGLGLRRQCAVTVGGFGPALVLAGESDMVATVPERHTQSLWRGLHALSLPFQVPAFTISLFWHPRLDADPAHRWLRSVVAGVCRVGK